MTCTWSDESANIKIRQYHESMSKCFNDRDPPPNWERLESSQIVSLRCDDKLLVDYDSVHQAFKHLKNKSVVFLGDSILMQQFLVFSCMLNSSVTALEPTSVPCSGFSFFCEFQIHFLGGITLLRMHRLGFQFNNIDTYEYIYRSELTSLSDGDLAFVNQGIHYNFVAKESVFPLAKFAELTVQIYEDVVLERGQESILPTVIWRESTPQNHPSSNGWWIVECYNFACECISLTQDMMEGTAVALLDNRSAEQKNEIACNPICCKANMRNMITNPIISASTIPICDIYDALAHADVNLHINHADCTHFGPDALIFMNMEMLKSARSARQIRDESGH